MYQIVKSYANNRAYFIKSSSAAGLWRPAPPAAPQRFAHHGADAARGVSPLGTGRSVFTPAACCDAHGTSLAIGLPRTAAHQACPAQIEKFEKIRI
ncbi:MAG: hypothetical protein ROZ00_13350 [Denitratisoma sp.]|nr:hypothetical protein [Denitratisoma sp.]